MDIRTILVAVFAYLLHVESSVLRGDAQNRREKRYLTPYPIPPVPSALQSSSSYIRNISSAQCPLNRARRASLSDEQMKQVLEIQGGSINPVYMAENLRSAQDNFPNMLPIPEFLPNFQDYETPYRTSSVLKSKLLSDLAKWKTFVKSTSSSPLTKTNENSINKSANVYNSVSVNGSARVDTKADILARELGSFLLNSDIPIQSIIDFISTANLSVHPRTLMSLDDSSERTRRIKRNTDGSQTSIDFCVQKGTETPDGFLNLCTACAVTTKLTSDKFPRYINEVICSASDRTCLTLKGTPHGACRETVLHLNFLRKRPGGCMMMIQNPGQGDNPVLVDAWESYTQPIRTGCSCAIDKRSRLVSAFFG